jgi:hypothetical protein
MVAATRNVVLVGQDLCFRRDTPRKTPPAATKTAILVEPMRMGNYKPGPPHAMPGKWGMGGKAGGQDGGVADRQLAAALAGSAASAAAGWPGANARSALTSTEARRWRWVVHPDSIDLYADSDVAPADELVLLSSGGALHHARVALEADGRMARIRLLPDDDPTHLATVTADERIKVTDEARIRYEALARTPRPRTTRAPSAAELDALAKAAAAEGVRLIVLDPAQVDQLATSTGLRTSPGGPDVFGVLCGDSDAPENWLRAGAALSAISVLATERGLSLVPSSAAVQIPRSRAVLRRLLPEATVPYLAVRIGARDKAAQHRDHGVGQHGGNR